MEILARFWKYFGRFGFFERKTETDPPESVSSSEDPPPTCRSIGSAEFGSNPVGSSSGSSYRINLDSPSFYGNPEIYRRNESWDLLWQLHGRNSLPWLCARDFNEIVKQSEKSGRCLRPRNHMQLFREVFDECELMDLGIKGLPFTWSKHYKDGVSIWERLDRAVASHEWIVEFPST